MEIEVVGALNAKKAFPECLLVMVVPPSVEELKKRLVERGSETEEQIQNRLARMDYELSHKDQYDYIIVNDDLEKAIKELSDIVDGKIKK
jgi:guanylate kinase